MNTNIKRTIPEQFIRDGYVSTLLKRDGNVAMYECRGQETNVKFFEVVKVRRHTRDKLDFNIHEGDEYLPSAREWGTHGWTFTDKPRAKNKYKKEVKKEQEQA